MSGVSTQLKQNDVKTFMQRYAVGLVGLLEHKVKIAKLGDLHQKMFSIHDTQGNWIDNSKEVPGAFLSFYKDLLGSTFPHRTQVIRQIIQEGNLINDHHREILNAPYTRDDIKKALFSIPGSKAPGLDGFSSSFYKDSWEVIGNDVLDACSDGCSSKW